MSDSNKNAPKVRSGDEINPVLASVIKIGGLIVIAALAVLITFILINTFKKDEETVNVYDDSYHLNYEDFIILTNRNTDDGNWENLSSDIEDVMININTNSYYIYFYYGSLTDELPEDEVEKLANMDQSYPLFFVNLERFVDVEDENVNTFLDVFDTAAWDDTFIEFEDDKDLIVLNKDKTKSFIIELSVEGRLEVKTVPTYIGVEIEEFIVDIPQKQENSDEE